MSWKYALELAEAGAELLVNSVVAKSRMAVTADTVGPSMTRQEFAEEADINNIMKNYEATGKWPFQMEREPMYLDFTAMPDLQTAMHHLQEADVAFMSLPAKVRKEFDNDPIQFVEYASKPENLSKMREWGLAPPEKAPEPPVRVEVVQPPPAAPAPVAPAPAAPAVPVA